MTALAALHGQNGTPRPGRVCASERPGDSCRRKKILQRRTDGSASKQQMPLTRSESGGAPFNPLDRARIGRDWPIPPARKLPRWSCRP